MLKRIETNIEAFPVKVKTLTTNRGAPDHSFNNEVFEAGSAEVLNNIIRRTKRNARNWKGAYNDVCRGKHKDPEKGVKVDHLSDTEDMTYMENTLPPREEVELLGAGR